MINLGPIHMFHGRAEQLGLLPDPVSFVPTSSRFIPSAPKVLGTPWVHPLQWARRFFVVPPLIYGVEHVEDSQGIMEKILIKLASKGVNPHFSPVKK